MNNDMDTLVEAAEKKEWDWFKGDEAVRKGYAITAADWNAMKSEHRDDFRFWSFLWAEPKSKWLKKDQSRIGAARPQCNVALKRLASYLQAEMPSTPRSIWSASAGKQRDVVLRYLSHLQRITTAFRPEPEVHPHTELLLRQLSLHEWKTFFAGSTLEELRPISKALQQAVTKLELEEDEATTKRRRELTQQIERIKKELSDLDSKNKRRLQDITSSAAGDTPPAKRPKRSTVIIKPSSPNCKLSSPIPDRSKSSYDEVMYPRDRARASGNLIDQTPTPDDLMKLAEPLTLEPRRNRLSDYLRTQAIDASNDTQSVVNTMLDNLHKSGIANIVARPGAATNFNLQASAKSADPSLTEHAKNEEAERLALLAEVKSQKEELKRIKLEPED